MGDKNPKKAEKKKKQVDKKSIISTNEIVVDNKPK